MDIRLLAPVTALAVFALAGCGGGGGSGTADMAPQNPGPGLTDSDGDGVADAQDAFPNDPDETMDSDGDRVGDNADLWPNVASAGFAASGVAPLRATNADTLEEALADSSNIFRAYSATVRYSRRDGVRHSMRRTDRYSVASVASDGDFGFRVTWRDENSDDPETTVHLRKTDLVGTSYRRDLGDAGRYSYWVIARRSG